MADFELLLPMDHFKKAAKNTMYEIWEYFMWLGQIMSGLVGIYAFMVLLKLIMAQILCKSIHKLHGWSWKIVVEVIPSVAKYLLFDNHTETIKELYKE